MAKLFPPAYQFCDVNGDPVAGGGVMFYSTGTTTKKSVYTDTALSVEATNSTTTTPKGQPLNSDGRFSQGDMYGSGTYTVVLFDSAGGQIWSRDDFNRDANPDDGLDTQMTINQTTDIITFKVDAVNAILFGWQKVADTGFITVDPKAVTADTTENTHRVAVLNSNAITVPAGTTALVSSVYITEPNITATGTVTDAATVYIKAAPSEGASNYAVWVDAGDVRLDGKANINDTTDATSGTDGSLQTDGGLSVVKAAWIGGNVTVTSAASPQIAITDTTNNHSLTLFADDDNATVRASASAGLLLQVGTTSGITVNTTHDVTIPNGLLTASGGLSVGNGTFTYDRGANSAHTLTIGGTSLTTEIASIEVGGTRQGDGSAYVDLIGETGVPGNDYGLRIQRQGGANATSEIAHVGTGNLYLTANTTGSIIIKNNSTDSVTVDSSNNVTVNAGDLTVSAGFVNLGSSTELTISSGAVNATKSYHTIDTESDAASDDLDTINGGATGDLLIINANNAARTVVAKDATGNLQLAGDFSMDDNADTLVLLYDGSNWVELSRSSNA